MRLIKKITLSLVFFTLIISSTVLYKTQTSYVITPQFVHNTLFDLYFPTNVNTSAKNYVKRFFYKHLMWYKIRKNKNLKNTLKPLQQIENQELPEEILQEIKSLLKRSKKRNYIQKEELRKKIRQIAGPNFQKDLVKIRQMWLYIIYSLPLAHELAQYTPPKKPQPKAATFSIQKTSLQVLENIITHSKGAIDYLIVGSGPAGSVIAHELTRNIPNARVVMIDAGSFVQPRYAFTETQSEFMESHNQRRSDNGSTIIRNGKAVGGGTVVNLDLVFSPLLPAIQKKIRTWVDLGHFRNNFFDEQKDDWGKLEKANQWIRKHVHTRKVLESEINTNNRILKNGHPYADTYELNSRNLCNTSEVSKISATEAFIMPALVASQKFSGTLSIIPDAKAKKIVFDNNNQKATGVYVEFNQPANHSSVIRDINDLQTKTNTSYFIPAKNIIVCGGALGSAELLLHSNLENPQIGKGIVLHPSMGILGVFDRPINSHIGLSASVYASKEPYEYFFESMYAEPEYIAAIHPGSGQDILNTIKNYPKLGGFGIMIIDTPSDGNCIYVDPSTNETKIHYNLTPKDKETLKKGLKEGMQILFDQGAQEVFIPSAEFIYSSGNFKTFISAQEARDAIDRLTLDTHFNFISSAHLQGSNKIGSHPNYSVVSPNFKVWNYKTKKEYSNLYICDSSIFPTSVGANPMQSIYVIAKLFSETLINTTANQNKNGDIVY